MADNLKIGVAGAGTMGHGIALVCARSGFPVVMRDVSEDFVQKGFERIGKFLSVSVEKGKLTADEMTKTMSRVECTTDLNQLRNCDIIVEAISENLELKKKLFTGLDGICKKEAVFASNTSSISISKLASVTKREGRFIGMHFMNPAPIMKLVEVVRGAKTSDETVEKIIDFTKRLEKVPVVVKDSPGFVLNRILIPMINEAAQCFADGVAKREDIDGIMKIGANHPMGPLELADLIGLDVCLSIMEQLYEGFKDPKYKPCQILKELVGKGFLGRKTGRGFYEYKR